jgi:putative ABC transport system substrate-binding protein
MTVTIGRRELLAALGGAAAAWPLAARAQQSAMPVIGVIADQSRSAMAAYLEAFFRGLGEGGFIEEHNVTIESRWGDGRNDRLPALAAELVRRRVAVIVAMSTPATHAAKAETTTIPIVFYTGSDPVAGGLVASLNRPGGNLTGIVNANVELVPKRMELLHEAVPTATVVAALINPANPTLAEPMTGELKRVAPALRLHLHVLHASSEREIEVAFEALDKLKAGALVIGTDPFFVIQSEKLAELTVRHAIPAIFHYRRFAASGGLMSYGGDLPDMYRMIGVYTGRILKGEKPGELPVQQSTKIELIINMKTAKALGITVPISLLGRADEVIE